MSVIPDRSTRGAGARLFLATVVAVALAAAPVAVSSGAEPSEATTYGADGIATQSLGTHFEFTQFESLSAQPDGSIVALRGGGLGPPLPVRRETYLADGAIDPAAPSAKVEGNPTTFAALGGKSFVLTDGHLLTRFDPDGSVDTSFGEAGAVRLGYPPSGVAELSSGKVAAVSVSPAAEHGVSAHVVVNILNPDGSLDEAARSNPSLGNLGPGTPEAEITPTPAGGGLVLGEDFLLELRADGTVDHGFGTDGFASGFRGAAGAGFEPDGSIEVVATATKADEGDIELRRFTSSGAPDPGFGPSGARSFDLGADERANVASWGPDGSVVVGGRSIARGECFDECEETPIVVAFGPSGDLDPGFGQGGALELTALAGSSESESAEGVIALARRPDGSVIAAGSAPPAATVAFLAALSPQGSLLASFGEGGIVRMQEPSVANQEMVGYAPTAEGGLLGPGTTDVGIARHPVLVRYGANGGLDPAFGGGSGYVPLAESGFADAFAVRGDEALVGLSSVSTVLSRLVLVGTGDGAPISSFGHGGRVPLPRSSHVTATAFAGGGDPVALVRPFEEGHQKAEEVFRFRPDGRLDDAFGDGGKIRLELPDGSKVAGGTMLSTKGGLLVAGGLQGRLVITSLEADGRPDPRFGRGGWSSVKVSGSPQATALARVGSYVYLAAIVKGGGGEYATVLMRFDRDGRPSVALAPRRHALPKYTQAESLSIVPTRGGVLVVLDQDPRPLVEFRDDGRVTTRPIGERPRLVRDLRATVVGEHLILGWSEFSEALEAVSYHLSEQAYGP